MRKIVILFLAFLLTACDMFVDRSLLEPAQFTYAQPLKESCNTNERNGKAGRTEDKETAAGASYNLRTPSNYNASVAHPLIVVYAPAGTSASSSERHVHLTNEATKAGFIVAYANNIRLSLEAIDILSSVPRDVANNWCIDSSRIFYTGHSDGGTITNALTFLPSSSSKPAAIAPSAAGMDTESLKQYVCPTALPVMVFHNTQDIHFYRFGKQTADWWADCNKCGAELTDADANGCRTYKDCPDGAKTFYCEGPGIHSTWPDKNHVLIDFFKRN